MSFLDWGACGTIIALIAFFYGIYLEKKLNKLNDRIAESEKKLASLEFAVSELTTYPD